MDEDIPRQLNRNSSPAGLPSCHDTEPDLDPVDDVVNNVHQSSTAQNNYFSSPRRTIGLMRPRNHEMQPQIHKQDAEDTYGEYI
ncbi:hypothetical protein J1614_004912 [Plenodomus biglobosus]|nr:hypothetical protein J1614_004912 [Plenodomus biglobosus]